MPDLGLYDSGSRSGKSIEVLRVEFFDEGNRCRWYPAAYPMIVGIEAVQAWILQSGGLLFIGF